MNEILGRNIMLLRKEHGLTQEQLANALGISYQAVSKWENGNSCPDISALPLLADLFSVSIDALFGRETLPTAAPDTRGESEHRETPEGETVPGEEQPGPGDTDLPERDWPDDDRFYVVLYHGREMVDRMADDPAVTDAKRRLVFHYEGPAQDVESDVSVEIKGRVAGSVRAGTSVDCGDVGGDVTAGTGVDCGSVAGDLSAGGAVDCGEVYGDVVAGESVDCGDVAGNVRAGTYVECGDVGGGVYAGSHVGCDDVGGNVCAGGRVDCGDVVGRAMSGEGRRMHVSRDESDDAEEPDDTIDRRIDDGIAFGMRMASIGSEIGKKISETVQRAIWYASNPEGQSDTDRDEEEER